MATNGNLNEPYRQTRYLFRGFSLRQAGLQQAQYVGPEAQTRL